MIAFEYRARRSDKDFSPVEVGQSVDLDEGVEYTLIFPYGCSDKVKARLRELGGDLIAPDLGVLSFRNFVGTAELAGVTLQVVSSKVSPQGVSQILEEISGLAAALVFGWRAPVAFAGSGEGHRSPVPYHQLQFLRQVMLRRRPGARLQDWLAAIERSATRRFEPERPVVSPERVRRLDQRAVHTIFSRADRLVPVPLSAPISSNPLARALTFGTPPQAHFPRGIAAPRGRLSFDTPENRFVKHVIGECLALAYRFADHPKVHESLRADCRSMLAELERFAGAPFLDDAGRLTSFTAPSQALAKADGYREVYGFWSDFSRHVSLPRTQQETTRLLEGRDMATLYEYWVFMKVVETVTELTRAAPISLELRRDDLGESLVLGFSAGMGSGIEVRYNPTYRRPAGTAYSTPLRPDVVLAVGGSKHAFDAKYRLDRFEVSEADADDGQATYKRADLYKMHTYRDAITNLRTAFVVYPGTEFVFFERAGAKHTDPGLVAIADGVGAIPLRPADADPAGPLRALISTLLSAPARASAL